MKLTNEHASHGLSGVVRSVQTGQELHFHFQKGTDTLPLLVSVGGREHLITLRLAPFAPEDPNDETDAAIVLTFPDEPGEILSRQLSSLGAAPAPVQAPAKAAPGDPPQAHLLVLPKTPVEAQETAPRHADAIATEGEKSVLEEEALTRKAQAVAAAADDDGSVPPGPRGERIYTGDNAASLDVRKVDYDGEGSAAQIRDAAPVEQRELVSIAQDDNEAPVMVSSATEVPKLPGFNESPKPKADPWGAPKTEKPRKGLK